MTTTLLSSLGSDLHGFKDQILSRETLTSAANINSHYCAYAQAKVLLRRPQSLLLQFLALEVVVASSGNGRNGGCGDKK